jgi:hypothetical protein
MWTKTEVEIAPTDHRRRNGSSHASANPIAEKVASVAIASLKAVAISAQDHVLPEERDRGRRESCRVLATHQREQRANRYGKRAADCVSDALLTRCSRLSARQQLREKGAKKDKSAQVNCQSWCATGRVLRRSVSGTATVPSGKLMRAIECQPK